MAALPLCCTALPAFAGESWEAVREQLFRERVLLDGSRVIAIDAPYIDLDGAHFVKMTGPFPCRRIRA